MSCERILVNDDEASICGLFRDYIGTLVNQVETAQGAGKVLETLTPGRTTQSSAFFSCPKWRNGV